MRWIVIAGMICFLPGCAAAVMGVSVAGGVMEVLKDGFDIKLDIKNMQVISNASQVSAPATTPILITPTPVFAPIVPN